MPPDAATPPPGQRDAPTARRIRTLPDFEGTTLAKRSALRARTPENSDVKRYLPHLAAGWALVALAAYGWQLTAKLPPGTELYDGGLLYSAQLFALFLSHRLAPFLAALVVAAAGTLLGRRALLALRLSLPDRAQRFLLSSAFGLGLLGLFATGLALVHLLLRPVVLGALIAIFAVEWRVLVCTLRAWARAPWPSLSRLPRGEAAAAVMLFAVLACCLALAALPPLLIDAVANHFYITQQFIQSRGFTALYWIPYSDVVIFHDFIFALGFLTGGPIAAKFLNALAGVWLTAFAYHLARRRLAPDRPWLAAAIACVTPLFAYVTWYGFTDLFFAAFCLSAIDCFLEWHEEPRPNLAVVAGLLIGMAYGVKITALFVAVLLLVAVIAHLGTPLRRRAQHSALLVLAAAVLAIPWAWRSYAHTGNPVYPALSSVWGEGSNTGFAHYVETLALSSYGSRATVADYMLTPLRLFTRQSYRIRAGGYGGVFLSPVLLLVLPWYLLFPPRRRDERSVLFFALGFFVLWVALLPHTPRYVLFSIPLFGVLCAALVSRALAEHRPLGRAALLVCLALLVFPCSWTVLWQRVADLKAVFFAVPAAEREVVARLYPSLPVLEAIDRSLPPGTPVFSISNVDHYYCQARLYRGWSARAGRAARDATEPPAAVEALRQVGVQGILFSDADQQSGKFVLFRPDTLQQYFRPVASANGWHFYLLRADTSASTSSAAR
jgi:hypothetical protein